MRINIKLTVDYAFKRIFGHKKNKKLLITLLNDILYLGNNRKIQSVELMNPFSIKDFKADKENILDIKATDNFGRMYDIEVQIDVLLSYSKRILLYACNMYSSQLKEGEPYSKLKPVISVNFLEEPLFKDNERYFNHFLLRNKENDLVLTEDISFFVFELSKFNLSFGELSSPIDEWLYLIKHSSEIDMDNPPLFRYIPYKSILKEISIMNQTEIERQQYEDRIKTRRDTITFIEEAYEKGVKKGRKEGVKKGIEKGRKEGIEKGIIQTAKKMKKAGFSIESIKEITGLSDEEINKII